jgi:hypothetical protein
MALNPFWSDTAARAALDAVCVLANAGKLRIYDGSQPTDANTAVGAQHLLAEFTMNATAFAASSCSGSAPTRVASAVANAIADVTASATYTAAWFRLLKSDGTTAICDGTVGTSGCDLNLTDITITSGETCRVSSFTLTNPE